MAKGNTSVFEWRTGAPPPVSLCAYDIICVCVWGGGGDWRGYSMFMCDIYCSHSMRAIQCFNWTASDHLREFV